MELKALEAGDIQTLYLIREIRMLRKSTGEMRSKFVKSRASTAITREKEKQKAFSHGVTAMRVLFPELPPISLNVKEETVCLYVPEV